MSLQVGSRDVGGGQFKVAFIEATHKGDMWVLKASLAGSQQYVE